MCQLETVTGFVEAKFLVSHPNIVTLPYDSVYRLIILDIIKLWNNIFHLPIQWAYVFYHFEHAFLWRYAMDFLITIELFKIKTKIMWRVTLTSSVWNRTSDLISQYLETEMCFAKSDKSIWVICRFIKDKKGRSL